MTYDIQPSADTHRRAYDAIRAVVAILWSNGPDTCWTPDTIQAVADAVDMYGFGQTDDDEDAGVQS